MNTMLPAPPTELLAGASLFLDFDGTLVELEDRPDLVRADTALIALTRQLGEALDGRLAIVTGRASGHILDLFGEVAFAIGGSHGVEFRWPDGRTATPELPATLPDVIAELHRFAEGRDGVIVETKPFGAGLHYRMAPHVEDDAHAVAAELARAHGLHLQPGKMMIELRAASGDKGAAIKRLMAEPPFAGTRPVFLGDDVTDEDGFRAVAALGGAGVLVGRERPTSAGYRLDDVQTVRQWLVRATEALR
ncbi:trehalose-phosphatase [Sphingomonas sp.]|uniref:trehalose-phosphatase n=1 Tax=Sphingomonas sp. TaxID=28214 RepID=UPI002CFA7650|nr:trehalose-phosphatase [Sphingomonas sp.]HTG38529.1 trehalose-phosphatase [Sphingomonas sp.]